MHFIVIVHLCFLLVVHNCASKYRHPATGTYTRAFCTPNLKQMIISVKDIIALAINEKAFLTRCDMLIDWLYKKTHVRIHYVMANAFLLPPIK